MLSSRHYVTKHSSFSIILFLIYSNRWLLLRFRESGITSIKTL
ncbi:hypothetical protein JCM19314_558 [Nonlabens ulvanivorans]|uniref:Uncharacterized protein n=1 Tax=Nonlabens ulvanivorans TaxID=906888 RepID=A0A090QG79_NONUL|nr:hypothetical protein JCM19314_558 [Nonlabens ulvanivorans]